MNLPNSCNEASTLVMKYVCWTHVVHVLDTKLLACHYCVMCCFKSFCITYLGRVVYVSACLFLYASNCYEVVVMRIHQMEISRLQSSFAGTRVQLYIADHFSWMPVLPPKNWSVSRNSGSILAFMWNYMLLSWRHCQLFTRTRPYFVK